MVYWQRTSVDPFLLLVQHEPDRPNVLTTFANTYDLQLYVLCRDETVWPNLSWGKKI